MLKYLKYNILYIKIMYVGIWNRINFGLMKFVKKLLKEYKGLFYIYNNEKLYENKEIFLVVKKKY